jgi:ribonuclease P protein component
VGTVLGFPKTSRLLKKSDFSFRPFKRFQTDQFKFVYSGKGTGRIGISISKKVLRRAVARNRIRRLVKESFRLRHESLSHCDVHVIAMPRLAETWSTLGRRDIEREWDAFQCAAKQ